MKHRLLVLLLASFWMGSSFAADPPASVYQLDARLTDQSGRARGLDVYRGSPVLVTMFYGSCKATCPLIIDALRATEKSLAPEQRAQLRVLLISFDPARDTPAALERISKERRVDTSRWTLATADENTVRDIAALLDVQYRRLPDGEFSHSASISLLSPHGEILAKTAELGHADPALVARLPGR